MRIALFFALFLPLLASASPWSDATKLRVDAYVERNFKNQSQVGIVVGAIHEGESYVWSYGERVRGGRELPTGDTFFEMGSITKTYTATLLAKEVLEGKVSLSTRVKALWPELSGTDAGEITLEQLATHSSGLPRMPGNFAPSDPLNPYKDYTAQNLFDFLKPFKQAKPGPYTHAYSNLGLGLLGYLLSEKLHSQTFSDYVEQNLLAPLALTDTKVALQPQDLVRAAQGYDSFFNPMPFWDLNVLSPAGALKTTINDLLKYVRFNMSGDDSLLGRAAALAQQPCIPTSEDPDFSVGLAWESGKLGDYSIVTHGGATGGYRANLAFDKEKRTGVVLLSNTDIAPKCLASAIFDVGCEVPTWAVVAEEKLQALMGSYTSGEIGKTFSVSVENGIPALNIPEQDKLRLWPVSDTEFRLLEVPVTIVFGAKGFLLTQNGKTYEFVKN